MAGQSRGRPGWLHVGALERRLTRAWQPGTFPPAESLLAVMTLSAVPRALGVRLAAHLDGGIVVGPGAVPDLPGFEALRGVALPFQQGRWERSAGVYDPGRRRVGVGSVPSPSVSVAGHELGHATDHLEGLPSRGAFWAHLHASRAPQLPPPFREDPAELYAEAFACVLTGRARRLIRLFGDEHAAQRAYLWISGRYGLG
ncbi:hypothetical protein FE391_41020 [Nonomuraea sp. KC401]|uniref:Uncharacterized protein n=1 Tax=Nonomuraea longispora TaxID=1848320 RepID=A0A4R4MLE0_9ACTN|nr:MULTISPECIES: hypothetical protein [Nonomuraea]NBE98078.1 hypothetical protein [Nonomuraea sp. K271]TDB96730.1 hypothetical protein E1267_40615 [Nonomuraea longispora]TLF55077.1 hypothetical protein FE391_41020 [Nonomuraea sp. KC401]